MAMSASPDPLPTTTRTVLKPLAGTFTLSDLPPPDEPVGVTVMSYWMFGPRCSPRMSMSCDASAPLTILLSPPPLGLSSTSGLEFNVHRAAQVLALGIEDRY